MIFLPPIFALRAHRASQLDGSSGAAATKLTSPPGRRLPTAHFRGGFAIFGHGFRVNLIISMGSYTIPTLIEFLCFLICRQRGHSTLSFAVQVAGETSPPRRRHVTLPVPGAGKATRARAERAGRGPAVHWALEERLAASLDGVTLLGGSATEKVLRRRAAAVAPHFVFLADETSCQ